MKINLLTAGVVISMFAAVFSGCNFDDDSGSSGEKKEPEHEWTATKLEITVPAFKISTYDDFILTVESAKEDFTAKIVDTHYADFSGEAKKDIDISEVVLSVDGKELASGEKFTPQLGKKCKLSFVYGSLPAVEYELTGIVEGSFVPREEEIKTLEGNSFSSSADVLKRLSVVSKYVFGIGTQSKKITELESLTAFSGADEASLVKIEGKLFDYVFTPADKIISIYNENIDSPSAATTLPYKYNLKIASFADVKNATLALNPCKSGTAVKLLDLIKPTTVIRCYNGTEAFAAGTLAVLDSEGKIRSGLTLEIHEKDDFSDPAVKVLNSSTTADEEWTPGEGTAFTDYQTKTSVNGVLKYSDPVEKHAYFIKIHFETGSTSFENSIEYTSDDSGHKSPSKIAWIIVQ